MRRRATRAEWRAATGDGRRAAAAARGTVGQGADPVLRLPATMQVFPSVRGSVSIFNSVAARQMYRRSLGCFPISVPYISVSLKRRRSQGDGFTPSGRSADSCKSLCLEKGITDIRGKSLGFFFFSFLCCCGSLSMVMGSNWVGIVRGYRPE